MKTLFDFDNKRCFVYSEAHWNATLAIDVNFSMKRVSFPKLPANLEEHKYDLLLAGQLALCEYLKP